MEQYFKDSFVANLKIKDNVDSIFLIKYIALMEGRDGRNYLNLVASDSSGELECRLWKQAIETYENVKKGDFAKIKGKINLYQGRKQLVIQEITYFPQDLVSLHDFVVSSQHSAEEMYARLRHIVTEQLDDVYIRDLLTLILDEPEIRRRLLIWQAGKTIHHAYQAGLLEHILSCTDLSVILGRHYKLNLNYVVAGAILHDLAKIYELTDGLNVDYTEEGKLVGHLAKGLELIDRFCYRIKNFPHLTKMHLKHIVISHHGSYEYGSPKVPQTSEAMLVHLIDYLDSKMNAFEMIKRNDSSPGHWSNFIKHLDRIVFKGELPHHDEYLTAEIIEREKAERFHKSERSERSERSEELEGHKNSKRVESAHQSVMAEEGKPKAKPNHYRPPKELKQNLGKFLEGFKVESKE